MDDFNYSDYLCNLLIIQYHDKPKAIGTIKVLTKDFPDELIFAVRDGFSIDSAVGKQLDILAKYIGVSRHYIQEDGVQVLLNDEEMRILLKLKAICNNTNCSHYDIDTALINFFGIEIHAESVGNMEMTYFIPSDATRVIKAALQQDVLPRPMGVGVRWVIQQDNKFFGYCTYFNQYAYYKTGYRTYDDPDKVGEMLTYDKITEIYGS